MPQLQILSPRPSFGEELGQQLGGGIGQGLSQSLNNMLEQKRNTRNLEGLRPFLKELDLGDDAIESIVKSGVNADMASNLAVNLSKIKQQRSVQEQKEKFEQQKAEKAQQAAIESKERSQKSLNNMIRLLKTGHLGGSFEPLFPGQRMEDRAAFNSSRGNLIAQMRDLVNKGVLSNQKFNFIVNDLIPKASDREATIRGKLRGIADELDLDLSELTGEGRQQESPNSEGQQQFQEGHSFSSLKEAEEAGPGAVVEINRKDYIFTGTGWKPK